MMLRILRKVNKMQKQCHFKLNKVIKICRIRIWRTLINRKKRREVKKLSLKALNNNNNNKKKKKILIRNKNKVL